MIEISSTERLNFRLLNDDDAELFFDLDSDPEVMRFINGGKPSTLDDIHNIYIPRLMSYTDPEKGWGMWGVFEKVSGEFIGWILIRPMQFFTATPEHGNLEIGWRFKRSAWGKGIATEAARQVLEVIDQDPAVYKLSAVADEKNLGSIAIMKKLGLSFVKQYLHRDPLGDVEAVLYEKQLR